MCSSPPHCFDEQIIEENFTESSDVLLDQFPPLNNPQDESVYEFWGSNQDFFPDGYITQTTNDWIMQLNNPTFTEDGEKLEENQDMFLEGDYLELNDLGDYSSGSQDSSWYNNQITDYTYMQEGENVYSATFTLDILM